MGLDMSIYGVRSFNGIKKDLQDKQIVTETVSLAYWRKHPNLHGFIVEQFGCGVDECQEIPLDSSDIMAIIDAIKNDTLPKTEGFFFGTSESADQDESIEQLTHVLQWLAESEKDCSKSIVYQASW